LIPQTLLHDALAVIRLGSSLHASVAAVFGFHVMQERE